MLPLIFINNIKINNMETKQIKCYCGHTITCDCGPLEKPKQETLEEAAEIDLTKLCYYDKRNPDFQIKEEYGYDKEEVEATGNFAKKDCACDNCFYGRSKLTEKLIWQQERMYSEEDLKEAFKSGHKLHVADIDHRLSVIEDYAKGEAGIEITKLRKYIQETYGK